MKRLYNMQELSTIVNRIVRKTPSKGAVAVVPDLINFRLTRDAKAIVPLPDGDIVRVLIWLELEEVEGKREKQTYKLDLNNTGTTDEYVIKEGMNSIKCDKQISEDALNCTLEGTDIDYASVTIQFVPSVKNYSLKQLLLEGDDICENLT